MGIPLRGRMSADFKFDCSTQTTDCADITLSGGNDAICAVPSGGSGCGCSADFGGSTTPTACTKSGVNTCAQLGEKACGLQSTCEWDANASPAAACKNKTTPQPPASNVIDCSAGTDETACAKITGCAFVSSKCECAAGYGGADNTKCAPCKGNEYKAAAGSAACSKCAEGSYTAPANGSAADVTNTTGPNTQCIAAGSSSASPLAILIICSLIISIIASIATAAVMIRRKATNARAAEAIVSDAL